MRTETLEKSLWRFVKGGSNEQGTGVPIVQQSDIPKST